jgi:hypothetical protein
MAIDGTDLEAELDVVFAATPETFTAARDALVKKLKAEKRKEDAAVVAAFRRPTAALWGMNQVARADGTTVEGLRRQGQVALRAQEQLLSGGSPADVLAAVEQRRTMVSALVNSVVSFLTANGVAADSLAPQLRSAFEMISVNAAAGAALQRGRLATIPTEADDSSGAESVVPAKTPRHLSVVREIPAKEETVEAPIVSVETSVAEPVDELAGAAESRAAELLEAERAEVEQRKAERVALREVAERQVNLTTEVVTEASKRVSELSVAAVEAATNEEEIRTEIGALIAEIEALQLSLAEKTSEANQAAERTRDAASQRTDAEQALSAAIRDAAKAKDALETLRSDAPDP